MAGTVLTISIEGVLCRQSESPPVATIFPAGVELMNALSKRWPQVVLATRGDSQRAVSDWLYDFGIPTPWTVVTGCVDAEARVDRLKTLFGKTGSQPSMYVDADPLAVKMMTRIGVPSMVFCHPKSTMVGWATKSSWVNDEEDEDEKVEAT